jgi:hypothetical protein
VNPRRLICWNSTNSERVGVKNGLAAFPMHDAAFDQGYLMANGYLAYYRENIFKG